MPKKVKRGRPVGHKLTAHTKNKIAKSKTGHIHLEVTKNKISCTLRNSGKAHGFCWTDLRLEQLEDLILQGYTQREIGEVMGCKWTSVAGAKSRYFPHLNMSAIQEELKAKE